MVVLPITTVGVVSIGIGIDIGTPKPKRVVPDHRVNLSLVEPTCCFRFSYTITSLHEYKARRPTTAATAAAVAAAIVAPIRSRTPEAEEDADGREGGRG